MINQNFETGVDGTVNGQILLKVLQKIPDEEIQITTKGDEFIIKGNKRKIGLKMTKDKIGIPFDVQGLDWFKLPTNFTEALKFSIFSAAKDATKGPFVCIYLNKDTLTSCDNYRATIYQLDKKFKFPFLLPRIAAEHLINYNPTLFSSTEAWLHFRNEEKTTFSCRTMADDYPDVSFFFDFEGKWIKFPETFKETVDRAGLLSTTDFEHHRKITITLSDGKIICKGEGK